MFGISVTNRGSQSSSADSLQHLARTALVLLLLLLAVSPVTQTLWKGDNFLHGQDTETTLVVGLTIASIALLKMERSRLDVETAFKGLCDLLCRLFGPWLLHYLGTSSVALAQPVSIPHSRGRPGNNSGYRLPLLI